MTKEVTFQFRKKVEVEEEKREVGEEGARVRERAQRMKLDEPIDGW